MASSQSVLTALITLGREAVEAVASTGDMATLRGAALLNLAWDSTFQTLQYTEPRRTPFMRCPSPPTGTGERRSW